MRYLLTYKFSQDHFELFLASVRACGGYNNHTVLQFMGISTILCIRFVCAFCVQAKQNGQLKDAIGKTSGFHQKLTSRSFVVFGHLMWDIVIQLSKLSLSLQSRICSARGGYNNNPTALQVKAAYRRTYSHTHTLTYSYIICTYVHTQAN